MNANSKRKLIWLLLIIGMGGLIGGIYFSPVLVIPCISLLGIVATSSSLDEELSEKITRYETPVDLQQLIYDSFPKENEMRPVIKDNKKEKERVLNEEYAKQVFFSDLKDKKDSKKDEGKGLTVLPRPS